MKIRSLSCVLFLVYSVLLSAAPTAKLAEISSVEGVEVRKVGSFEHPLISESSGLAISRQWKNIMWTHNDSGDSARIFATDLEGHSIFPKFETADTYEGLVIGDAYNVDWEDIATDNEGNLYIAACGNNVNMRRDLAIYKIREPHPLAAVSTRYFQIYRFEWPDQHSFPPEQMNFDCEAVFWVNGTLYVLSKNRSDTFTKLYRFEELQSDQLNIPSLVATFDIGGQVTAADSNADGSKLAILTYDNIWVFEDSSKSGEWFNGNIKYLKTSQDNIKQCEGIAFIDEDTLLITNEQRDIFELKLEEMVTVIR